MRPAGGQWNGTISNPVSGSRDCTLSMTGLVVNTGTKTLTANGGAEQINLFQITNVVEVYELYCYVLTDFAANLTGAHFELYDSAAAIDLTKNDGVISSLKAGSWFSKCEVAANTMSVQDATNGFFTEDATLKKPFQSMVLGQKTGGADTYIRLNYTAAGAASGTFIAILRYHCKSVGGVIEAV